MPIHWPPVPIVVSVARAATGVLHSVPNTYIVIERPTRRLRIGAIIEFDIVDGLRYRTWDVRILGVRVLEEHMVELTTSLHGPDDGALPTTLLLQCRCAWVYLGPLPALQAFLGRDCQPGCTIPIYPPLASPSLVEATAPHARRRHGSRHPDPARQSCELVGRISYTVVTTTTSSPSPIADGATRGHSRSVEFQEGGIRVESGRAAQLPNASL
ncbi:hypothetical protein C2E23DRAFT_884608 [Lenzites betulinus]|nr:hypothetical protein C2E23DRAFT_884608 [Lenzites betulinus]